MEIDGKIRADRIFTWLISIILGLAGFFMVELYNEKNKRMEKLFEEIKIHTGRINACERCCQELRIRSGLSWFKP